MLMEGDLTLDGEHTIQYTDNVLQNYTLKTYIILLANGTPIHSIKKFLLDEVPFLVVFLVTCAFGVICKKPFSRYKVTNVYDGLFSKIFTA